MNWRTRVTTVTMTALVTFALTACSSPNSEDTAQRFIELAQDPGYNCAETVPPDDAIILLRTCRGEDGSRLVFASFADQETLRRMSHLVLGGAGSSVAEQGSQLIAGEDAGDVADFAAALGFNAPS